MKWSLTIECYVMLSFTSCFGIMISEELRLNRLKQFFRILLKSVEALMKRIRSFNTTNHLQNYTLSVKSTTNNAVPHLDVFQFGGCMLSEKARFTMSLQWNPDFSNLRGKRKFGSKILFVWEIGGNCNVRLRGGKLTSLRSRLSGGSKHQGFEKSRLHLTFVRFHVGRL